MEINLDLLKEIDFFDSFSDEILSALIPFFSAQKFNKGDLILEQNGLNLELFFLVQGSVNISIDEEYVVTLHKNGEVFGEMSVAGHTTCSANVEANEDSDFLIFDFSKIQNLDDPLRLKAECALLRSCSEVLVQKLINTNEIAKTYRLLSQKP